MIARSSIDIRRWAAACGAALLLVAGGVSTAARQPAPSAATEAGRTALRDAVTARFDVTLLQRGVALVPKQTRGDVRLIEVSNGAVLINGAPVTGRELRDRLGASDADLALQLSYLDDALRRALFAPPPPVPTPTPTQPSIDTPIEQPASPSPGADIRPNRYRRHGAVVRIFTGASIDEDEIVSGDVVVVLGSARIDGEVRENVVVVLGGVTLGPKAVVHRDLTVIGGSLRRASGARVDGDVVEVSLGDVNINVMPFGPPSLLFGPLGELLRIAGLLFTTFRIILFGLLAAATLIVARDAVQRTGAAAAAEPWKAGFVGLAAQLLFAPILFVTSVILLISIIGIPLLLLLPFVIVGFLLFSLLGFAGVALRVGETIQERIGWMPRPFVAVWLGVVTLALLTIGGRLVGLFGGGFSVISWALLLAGGVIEYVAWTTGLGAALMTRFQRRPAAALPPPPPPADSPLDRLELKGEPNPPSA
jgi:hypothetical protein